jgi:hypothetical protein
VATGNKTLWAVLVNRRLPFQSSKMTENFNKGLLVFFWKSIINIIIVRGIWTLCVLQIERVAGLIDSEQRMEITFEYMHWK